MDEKGLNVITYISVTIIVIAAIYSGLYIDKQKKNGQLNSKRSR